MKIINFGHSCFKIETENYSIIFDPYQNDSVPNLLLPNICCDEIFISHEHHDHNARELIVVKGSPLLKVKKVLTPHDKDNGKLRGNNFIHLVEIDNYKIAHLGDLGTLDTDLSILKEADIIFSPINGFYTISALEALKLLETFSPKIFIPMHYYNKHNNSGYPDGNQIDIFLNNLNRNIKYVKDEIVLDSNTSGVIIFKEVRQ